MQNQALFREIEQLKAEMATVLMELIRVPAIGPKNGGDGELQKAEKLVNFLETAGFDKIERCDAEDKRVSSKESRSLDAKVGGVGGGTCVAFFRQVGIPAVVWSTVDEVAHQPNEYAKVENMVNDAKIFALLAVR